MIEATQSAILLKALDGLDLRMRMIAHNIANAQSPHFRPVSISFEDRLKLAAQQGNAAVKAVRPSVSPSPMEGVRLDMELAHAVQTSGRYKALADFAGRQIQLYSLAVARGR